MAVKRNASGAKKIASGEKENASVGKQAVLYVRMPKRLKDRLETLADGHQPKWTLARMARHAIRRFCKAKEQQQQ